MPLTGLPGRPKTSVPAVLPAGPDPEPERLARLEADLVEDRLDPERPGSPGRGRVCPAETPPLTSSTSAGQPRLERPRRPSGSSGAIGLARSRPPDRRARARSIDRVRVRGSGRARGPGRPAPARRRSGTTDPGPGDTTGPRSGPRRPARPLGCGRAARPRPRRTSPAHISRPRVRRACPGATGPGRRRTQSSDSSRSARPSRRRRRRGQRGAGHDGGGLARDQRAGRRPARGDLLADRGAASPGAAPGPPTGRHSRPPGPCRTGGGRGRRRRPRPGAARGRPRAARAGAGSGRSLGPSTTVAGPRRPSTCIGRRGRARRSRQRR